MNRSSRFPIAILVMVLIACGCSPKEESPKANSQNKVRDAVKEVVTENFKAYEGVKESLKESQDKNKSGIEAADQELSR